VEQRGVVGRVRVQWWVKCGRTVLVWARHARSDTRDHAWHDWTAVLVRMATCGQTHTVWVCSKVLCHVCVRAGDRTPHMDWGVRCVRCQTSIMCSETRLR